jgi:hypothetical protein
MVDNKVGTLLSMFDRVEREATSGDALDQVELQYRQALSGAPRAIPLLVAYNRFRLRHASRLRHRRPKVLVGYVNDALFPNFHTIPLLRVADVVSLTTGQERLPTIDRVSYDPATERLGDVLSRLPEGFAPDLFWDNQVEHRHVIPLGLEAAPFPLWRACATCSWRRPSSTSAGSSMSSLRCPGGSSPSCRPSPTAW